MASARPDLPDFDFAVDRSQLLLFAKSIGEARAIYVDPAKAREAGYSDLPAPPTFLFSISMNPAAPFDMIEAIGADLSDVLHGEQEFQYFAPICAGDNVRVRRSLVESYVKPGSKLNFNIVEARLEDARGALLATARQTIIVRDRSPS